jgi:hypothetical protein
MPQLAGERFTILPQIRCGNDCVDKAVNTIQAEDGAARTQPSLEMTQRLPGAMLEHQLLPEC